MNRIELTEEEHEILFRINVMNGHAPAYPTISHNIWTKREQEVLDTLNKKDILYGISFVDENFYAMNEVIVV